MENRFLQNSCKYKNMILKQLLSMLYMDRIQYTWNILYLCFWHENQDRLNRKSKHETLNLKHVCVVNLSISILSNLYTRSKQSILNKPISSCRMPSSSLLDPNVIYRAWLQRSARCEHDARALESPCESSKTPLLKLITY